MKPDIFLNEKNNLVSSTKTVAYVRSTIKLIMLMNATLMEQNIFTKAWHLKKIAVAAVLFFCWMQKHHICKLYSFKAY